MKATITLDYEEFEHLKELKDIRSKDLIERLEERLEEALKFNKAYKENKVVQEAGDFFGHTMIIGYYNNPEEFFRIKELQEELKQKIGEASKKDDINNYRIIGFKIRKRG